MGDPLSCADGLDCNGECGGPAVEDECGVCGGLGYNDGGCCGDETSCLSFANINTIFETEYNSTRCTDCHGDNGGLILTTYSALMSGGNNGPVIIPLDSENSNLILKLKSSPPFNSQMPLGGSYLDASIIAQIAAWIDQGAIESPGNSQ